MGVVFRVKRMGRCQRTWAACVLGLGGFLHPDAGVAQTDPAGAVDPIGGYLSDLEQRGRLQVEEASLGRLQELLAKAEQNLVAGDARQAASDLYLIVESPRFDAYKDAQAFENAEYLLGRALFSGGAAASAERYLLRVLARGPDCLYFVPAHRSMVDIALARGDFARVVAVLEQAVPAPSLPPDALAESAYLRGRAAYLSGDLRAAATALARVDRTSRLYASAAYFRGLIAARRRAFDEARGAFCEILPSTQGSTLAFTIDGRYYRIQDLARLALARIAHEQDRYDEAYYFYFSIPEESDRLAEALFEAAWSMYQKGEADAARAFVEAFESQFPASPLQAEVAMLRATIAVKSCNFVEARTSASDLVATYTPVQKLAARAVQDPAFSRRLAHRMVAAKRRPGAQADPEWALLTQLKLDPDFTRFAAMLRDVDLEIREAESLALAWRTLGAQLLSGKVADAATSPAAGRLREDVARLLTEAEREPDLLDRAETLMQRVSGVSHPPVANNPYAAELALADKLVTDLRALRAKLRVAAETLVGESVRELDERLRGLFRQVRLVHIDAVVGRKKKLEVEIANLRAGRLSPELYFKLKAEGTLADDEEYWPFEGEYWADEYENYR